MSGAVAQPAGRTALVTGAAQGLGFGIAQRLVNEGFRVVLADIDGATAAATAVDADPTGRTLAIRFDAASPASIEDLVERVGEVWGAPDVLVNNASVTAKESVWDISVDSWDRVLATNLRSYFLLSRLCAVSMRERGWGRIVNMSSFAGQQGGLVAGAHYAASKAGAIVLTKIFARELAGDGVTVNALAPAAVQTPAMGDDEIARLADAVPVGRVGQAEEVAAAVAYLVGPDSGFVTGTTLDINGGIHMR